METMPPSALLPAAASPQIAVEASQESPDSMGYQCDRTAFLWNVRQRIAEWKRGGEPFCVLLLQVQQNEYVVETQSQKAREDVLRLTSRILHATVREMDLIGRYDHDCFSFLLPRTTLREGRIVAQRVARSIDVSGLSSNRSPGQFALHVGVTEVVEGDDVTRLLKRAEAAMSVVDNSGICCRTGQWPEVAPPVAQPPALDLPAESGAAGVDSFVATT
jgi:diguanylate cyclase (GGDEF)-like protein